MLHRVVTLGERERRAVGDMRVAIDRCGIAPSS